MWAESDNAVRHFTARVFRVSPNRADGDGDLGSSVLEAPGTHAGPAENGMDSKVWSRAVAHTVPDPASLPRDHHFRRPQSPRGRAWWRGWPPVSGLSSAA